MGILDDVKKLRQKRQAAAGEQYRRALWQPDADPEELLRLAETAGRAEDLEADLAVGQEARALLAEAERLDAARKEADKADRALERAEAKFDRERGKLEAELDRARARAGDAGVALGAAERAVSRIGVLRETHPELLADAPLPAAVAEADRRKGEEAERRKLRGQHHQAQRARQKAERELAEAERRQAASLSTGAEHGRIKAQTKAARKKLWEAEAAEAEAHAALEAVQEK